MAGNTMTLEFGGDAAKLQKAAKQSTKAVDDVAASAKEADKAFSDSGKSTEGFTDKIGKLGAGVTGMTDAIDTAAGGLQAIVDVQDAARESSSRLARANNDVKQAQEDYNQALRDGKQAAIDSDQAEVDLEQARLDQATALKDYNTAVKEHGRNSAEARQAQIDLKQAGIDVKQANEDAAQATRDASQANIDAEASQLDLNDAMREAHPPELQGWADKLNLLSPLLSAVVGVVGLVTAAQWAWNSSLLASPVTWIVLAIAAVIAGIVLLVKNWDTVKRAGAAAWDWIKNAAQRTWDWMKKIPGWIADAFKSIGKAILSPFRWAFNMISDAWNNTIGKLSWTVPGWIPKIGGNTISVPHLPHFHAGGQVPNVPGGEMLAVLQSGEQVTARGGDAGGMVHVVVRIDHDTLIDAVAKGVGRRGGDVQNVLGSS